MNLAIFGGSGRTGVHLVRQALAAGYQVTVLGRDPVKLQSLIPGEPLRLKVVNGDATDPDCVEQVISGVDAVISVLGSSSNQPVFEVSRATQNILAAMEKFGIRRLIITAGAGVSHPGDAPKLFNRFMDALVKAVSKNVYLDMLKTVDLVRSSKLDWTVVRVPMLVDSTQDQPGWKTGQLRVGMVGKGVGPRLARVALAGYLLRLVQEDEQVRLAPAISN